MKSNYDLAIHKPSFFKTTDSLRGAPFTCTARFVSAQTWNVTVSYQIGVTIDVYIEALDEQDAVEKVNTHIEEILDRVEIMLLESN